MKRRLGGIPHAATPLFFKAFGEFVLPARIPPDRLKGDPTPLLKGVFGAGKQFDKFLFAFLSGQRCSSKVHDVFTEIGAYAFQDTGICCHNVHSPPVIDMKGKSLHLVNDKYGIG